MQSGEWQVHVTRKGKLSIYQVPRERWIESFSEIDSLDSSDSSKEGKHMSTWIGSLGFVAPRFVGKVSALTLAAGVSLESLLDQLPPEGWAVVAAAIGLAQVGLELLLRYVDKKRGNRK